MDRHSSENVDSEDDHSNTDEVSETDEPKYLYRLCRPDEDPAQDLVARDPTATHVPAKSHVHGQKASPFISTCATFEAIQKYIGLAINNKKKLGKVVQIDLNRLRRVPGVRIIDLSDQDVIDREFLPTDRRGRNYATRYSEVLVQGGIPADCIEVLENVEESEEFEADDYSREDDEQEDEFSKDNDEMDYETDEDVNEEADHSSEHVKRIKRHQHEDEDPEEGVEEEMSSDEEAALTKENVRRRNRQHVDDQSASKELERLTETFKESLVSFISKREQTIRLLKELVELLNACRSNGNITKITGAGVSIVGAVAAVASIPLTGGMSVLALTAGGLFSVCGGLTGIGGEMYVNSREKSLMSQADEILKHDQEEAERLQQSGAALQSHINLMTSAGLCAKVAIGYLATTYAKMFISRLFGLSGTVGKIGKMATSATGSIARMGRIAKGTSAVLSVVFVPLDIWQIVDSSSELVKDNSEKAQMVTNIIDDLEKDLSEKKELLDE